MATLVTAFTSAAQATYGSGTINLADMSNAVASDDTYTGIGNPQPTPGDDFTTHYLTVTGLASKVPNDATITDLVITVARKGSATPTLSIKTVDARASLMFGGVVQVEDQKDALTPYPAAEAEADYTFTTLPTVAQANAETFGFAIAFTVFGDPLGDPATDSWPNVDYIYATFTYTAAPSLGNGGFSAFSFKRGDSSF